MGPQNRFPRLLSTVRESRRILALLLTVVFSSSCQVLCFCTVDDIPTSILNSLKDGN